MAKKLITFIIASIIYIACSDSLVPIQDNRKVLQIDTTEVVTDTTCINIVVDTTTNVVEHTIII